MNLTVQEIFRKFYKEYTNYYNPTGYQKNIAFNIMNCRTKVFGTTIYLCSGCGKKVIMFNSCNNRHCPTCQNYKKEKWLSERKKDILDVNYYHVVLGIPKELKIIFYHNKEKCYDILIKSASFTLLNYYNEYGITPGVTSILHTWSQKGEFHPHVHLIVTAGGMKENRWEKIDLIDIQKLEEDFKYNLIENLNLDTLTFYNTFSYLNNKEELKKFFQNILDYKFICYLKEPLTVEDTYEYISRYIYKVWISNERILSITDKKVKFKYKDFNNRSKERVYTVDGIEFIRRYMIHILPKSFAKVRYYGLYRTKNKQARMEYLRQITNTNINNKSNLDKLEILAKMNNKDVSECDNCNSKLIIKYIKPKKNKE